MKEIEVGDIDIIPVGQTRGRPIGHRVAPRGRVGSLDFVSVPMSPEAKGRLRERAASGGISVSEFVRRAIAAYGGPGTGQP